MEENAHRLDSGYSPSSVSLRGSAPVNFHRAFGVPPTRWRELSKE
jgi:hypothetical protein